MELSRKKMLGLATIVLLILILAIIFWLKPSTQDTKNSDNTLQLQRQAGQVSSISKFLLPEAISFAIKSQQDTQINCQIRTDASNRLIVNEQTKDCFEYFITQYGEKTVEQIKTDFLSYIKVSYQDPVRSQLGDLWTRYVNYRNKLGTTYKHPLRIRKVCSIRLRKRQAPST